MIREGQDHLLTSTPKRNITPRIGRLNMHFVVSGFSTQDDVVQFD